MKREIFTEVQLSFVLLFDNYQTVNIETAREELNPTREIVLNEKTIMFLESDRKIMYKGIDIPKKFADAVRLMAIMPQPEDGHIDGENVVSFGAFLDSCNGECLPYQTDSLIGEYYLFELELGSELEQSFYGLFFSIIGQKFAGGNIGISVGQNVYKTIVEVVDTDENEMPNNYSMRLPKAKDICLAKTKNFDNKVKVLLKR